VTLEEKLVAMNALLHLIEAERLLREKVPQVRDELPELWKAQIDGVKAERNDPKWQPTKRLTLGALIPMLAPHLGHNKALNYLPRYPDQYDKLINIRNAIGHGDWDELTTLGGSAMALRWAQSFYRLVRTCEDVMASAILQLKGGWEWPE
jgi:hypothetical protein